VHARTLGRGAFTVGAAASSVALCARGRASAQQTAVRVASNAADDVTPVLWALHTGAFAAAGLDVTFTRMNSGAAVTAAVLGGALDIGKSSLLPLISAHARSLPVAIIAPGEMWFTQNPITGMIVLKSSPIASAKDLIGKTVATAALKDLSWTATHAWLDQHGGNAQSMKFVELPQSAMVAALIDGRIDAATITNPGFSAALSTGRVKSIGAPSDAIGARYLLTAWFGTSDYIIKNRGMVATFARVVEQTAAYTNAHPADTLPLLASFSGIEPAALMRMTRGLCGTRSSADELQPVIDAAAKYQIIDKRFDAADLLAKLA
jgi:NitT/TauT family transport system substrate-binding protein